ncbi:MAG: hypothetical protein ACI4OT_00105 [Bacilli bacterium]
MNNKGFAITSMVYGLVLLASLILFLTLGVLDMTNVDNDKFTDDVEEKLIYCDYTYNSDTKTCKFGEE